MKLNTVTIPNIPKSFNDDLQNALNNMDKNDNQPVKQLKYLNEKLDLVGRQLEEANRDNAIRDQKNRRTQWFIGISSAILGALFGTIFTLIASKLL